MAKTTGIPWARSTFNPWIGCTKVSVSHALYRGGCDHCYAETQDGRSIFAGEKHWGPGVPRLRTSSSNWNEVRRWNRQAPESTFAGHKGFWPVFSASLGDIFDNEVPTAWRDDFWALVRECRNLTFLVLTKRIGNAKKGMLPDDFGAGAFPHVWLGASVCSQPDADRDLHKLLSIDARVHFLSMEPLLGPVLLRSRPALGMIGGDVAHAAAEAEWLKTRGGIGWVIAGAESGNGARNMDPNWPRCLRDQCAAMGVAFFMKQITHGGKPVPKELWPDDLKVQQFPAAAAWTTEGVHP